MKQCRTNDQRWRNDRCLYGNLVIVEACQLKHP
jgi:hypothetical protein